MGSSDTQFTRRTRQAIGTFRRRKLHPDATIVFELRKVRCPNDLARALHHAGELGAVHRERNCQTELTQIIGQTATATESLWCAPSRVSTGTAIDSTRQTPPHSRSGSLWQCAECESSREPVAMPPFPVSFAPKYLPSLGVIAIWLMGRRNRAVPGTLSCTCVPWR